MSYVHDGFRRPRNIATKRALLAAAAQRAACASLRGEKVPPDAYDDIPRRKPRSWKNHRPSQYHYTYIHTAAGVNQDA